MQRQNGVSPYQSITLNLFAVTVVFFKTFNKIVMRTNSNLKVKSQSNFQDLDFSILSEPIKGFLNSDNPNEHIERLNDLLIHRLVYTDEHDLSQEAKQLYQFTIMEVKQLIIKLSDFITTNLQDKTIAK